MKKIFILAIILLFAAPCFAQLVLTANLQGVVNAPIDQNGWQSFKITLTQNITFNFVIIPPAPLPAQATLRVIFTQDATGGRTVIFASNILAPCSVAASSGATTVCQFIFDGTTNTWQGLTGATGGGAPYPVLINQTLDLFNRAGANLGANWTNYQNGWVPNSGSAHGTAGSGGSNVAAYTAVTTGSSATERCRVVVSSFGTADSVGCALRIGGTAGTSANYYACFEQTTGPAFDIVKVVGGTSASNGTVTVEATNTTTASANGDFIDFKVVGNTLTCNLDYNKVIIQANDASSPLTSGFPGLYEGISASTTTSFLVDDFVIPATATANIVVDGDSLANGDGPTGSASYSNSFSNYLIISGAGTQPYVRNVAVDLKALGVGIAAINAGTIETMLATGTSVVDTMLVPGIPNLVVLWACTNDIANGGRTAAQCITDTMTYVTARHAVGWKVIVVQAISRNIAGDPNLQVLNQSLGTVGADGVVVLTQALTNTSSFGNQALFQTDGIHPTILASEGPLARSISGVISQIPGF